MTRLLKLLRSRNVSVSILTFAAALSLFSETASCQTNHNVTLGWTASITQGVSNYKIYRAPCNVTVTNSICPVASEGTFAYIGQVSAPAITYVDSTVTAGASYSYYVTSLCPSGGGCGQNTAGNTISGESAASMHVGAAIPANTVPPAAPTALTIRPAI